MRTEKLPNGGVGFISIVVLSLMTTLLIAIPADEINTKQTENITIIEVPGISDLTISGLGLNSITLIWSKPPESAHVTIFKIYVDETLIDTLDGSSNTYTITRLRPGNWYNFHVDACNTSGKCSTGGSRAGASTLTLQEATEAIIMKVDNLTSSGVLNEVQGGSLIRNLAAIYQFDNMNSKTTITQLQGAINNINSLIADGVLSQESGQTLIDATNNVIGNI